MVAVVAVCKHVRGCFPTCLVGYPGYVPFADVDGINAENGFFAWSSIPCPKIKSQLAYFNVTGELLCFVRVDLLVALFFFFFFGKKKVLGGN